jgi:hypothetical protein
VIAASMEAFQQRLLRHMQAKGEGAVVGKDDLPPGMQRELDEVGFVYFTGLFA